MRDISAEWLVAETSQSRFTPALRGWKKTFPHVRLSGLCIPFSRSIRVEESASESSRPRVFNSSASASTLSPSPFPANSPRPCRYASSRRASGKSVRRLSGFSLPHTASQTAQEPVLPHCARQGCCFLRRDRAPLFVLQRPLQGNAGKRGRTWGCPMREISRARRTIRPRCSSTYRPTLKSPHPRRTQSAPQDAGRMLPPVSFPRAGAPVPLQWRSVPARRLPPVRSARPCRRAGLH